MKRMKAWLWIGVFILAGCTSTSEFYQMPISSVSQKHATRLDRVVGIAEVKLPEYLDQSELLMRIGREKLVVFETRRWAGGLDENIQQVLQAELMRQLPSVTFVTHPYREPMEENYRIYLTVDRFDWDANGTVRFQGRWSIADMAERRVVRSGYVDKASDTNLDLTSQVDAAGKLVRDVAKEIAASLRKLPY